MWTRNGWPSLPSVRVLLTANKRSISMLMGEASLLADTRVSFPEEPRNYSQLCVLSSKSPTLCTQQSSRGIICSNTLSPEERKGAEEPAYSRKLPPPPRTPAARRGAYVSVELFRDVPEAERGREKSGSKL